MNLLYLAMYGDKVSIPEAIFISIFAMLVVFLVLLIISYMIDITAGVIKKGTSSGKKSNGVVNISTAASTPKKSDDSSAVVAAIAAAVATYLGTSSDNIKIVSIRRVNPDSTWSKNGLLTQING